MLFKPTFRIVQCLAAASLLLLGAPLTSCTIAAAGAAMSAAQSGATIIKKGRVTTAVLARYEDVLEAVEHARDVLSLDTRREVDNEDHRAYFFEEADGGKMSVYVSRRTDSVTSIVIDVGTLGRPDVARLMYAQVMDNLADADAFLEDWNPSVMPSGQH